MKASSNEGPGELEIVFKFSDVTHVNAEAKDVFLTQDSEGTFHFTLKEPN